MFLFCCRFLLKNSSDDRMSVLVILKPVSVCASLFEKIKSTKSIINDLLNFLNGIFYSGFGGFTLAADISGIADGGHRSTNGELCTNVRSKPFSLAFGNIFLATGFIYSQSFPS